MAETKEDLWNNKAMRKNVSRVFFLCCGQGDLPPLKEEEKSGSWGKGEHHKKKLQAAKSGESAHASHAWSRPALRENGGTNGRQAENKKETRRWENRQTNKYVPPYKGKIHQSWNSWNAPSVQRNLNLGLNSSFVFGNFAFIQQRIQGRRKEKDESRLIPIARERTGVGGWKMIMLVAGVLRGSLFTNTVAVCSRREGLPNPLPSARGSGYWAAMGTAAACGCNVATISGVQEPCGWGFTIKEGKMQVTVREGKKKISLRVKSTRLWSHTDVVQGLLLPLSATSIHD